MHELLTVVIRMNKNRILSRLRSKHSQSPKRTDRNAILSRLSCMVDGVCSMTAPSLTNDTAIRELRITNMQLMKIFVSLEVADSVTHNVQRKWHFVGPVANV